MRIYERELSRREVMRRVGNLLQVGGIEHVSYQDGHARGVRALQVNTGAGLRFSVTPDRGGRCLSPLLLDCGERAVSREKRPANPPFPRFPLRADSTRLVRLMSHEKQQRAFVQAV